MARSFYIYGKSLSCFNMTDFTANNIIIEKRKEVHNFHVHLFVNSQAQGKKNRGLRSGKNSARRAPMFGEQLTRELQ